MLRMQLDRQHHSRLLATAVSSIILTELARRGTQFGITAWDRGPMRIKARVTQIWAFCVPAVVSVIRDGTCPAGGQR